MRECQHECISQLIAIYTGAFLRHRYSNADYPVLLVGARRYSLHGIITAESIDAEIKKVKNGISEAKARYDSLAEDLQKLEKQKRAMQAEKIMDAFEKSGKTYNGLMTFLNA